MQRLLLEKLKEEKGRVLRQQASDTGTFRRSLWGCGRIKAGKRLTEKALGHIKHGNRLLIRQLYRCNEWHREPHRRTLGLLAECCWACGDHGAAVPDVSINNLQRLTCAIKQSVMC